MTSSISAPQRKSIPASSTSAAAAAAGFRGRQQLLGRNGTSPPISTNAIKSKTGTLDSFIVVSKKSADDNHRRASDGGSMSIPPATSDNHSLVRTLTNSKLNLSSIDTENRQNVKGFVEVASGGKMNEIVVLALTSMQTDEGVAHFEKLGLLEVAKYLSCL
jgi:hypothetical protein